MGVVRLRLQGSLLWCKELTWIMCRSTKFLKTLLYFTCNKHDQAWNFEEYVCLFFNGKVDLYVIGSFPAIYELVKGNNFKKGSVHCNLKFHYFTWLQRFEHLHFNFCTEMKIFNDNCSVIPLFKNSFTVHLWYLKRDPTCTLSVSIYFWLHASSPSMDVYHCSIHNMIMLFLEWKLIQYMY